MLQQIPPSSRIAFSVLFLIWGIAYIVGMIVGRPEATPWRRLSPVAKIVMIGVTLAFGGIWWLGFARGTVAAAYAVWIMLGLTAGGVADLVLADLFPLEKPELPAMGIFGIGHVLYIVAMLTLRRLLGLRAGASLFAAALISVAAGVLVWNFLIRNPEGSRRLNIGSLVYGILLLLAAGLAIELAIEAGGMAILALGLSLFAVSDLILAQDLIRHRRFPLIRDVVWIIYSTAQVMIAFSIGAALRLV
ncbi:MAG TPA: hypothetical protein ENI95_08160 [Chloroflexi bacterium]|nr:hypothetical protein [Chloroflexota bacterium]